VWRLRNQVARCKWLFSSLDGSGQRTLDARSRTRESQRPRLMIILRFLLNTENNPELLVVSLTRPSNISPRIPRFWWEIQIEPKLISTSPDPSSPTSRILPNFPPQEDSPTSLRWITMCKLRSGSYRSSILDWGAKDRKEGVEGVSTKKALEWEGCVCFGCWTWAGLHNAAGTSCIYLTDFIPRNHEIWLPAIISSVYRINCMCLESSFEWNGFVVPKSNPRPEFFFCPASPETIWFQKWLPSIRLPAHGQ
jgi:hypothetical protein